VNNIGPALVSAGLFIFAKAAIARQVVRP